LFAEHRYGLGNHGPNWQLKRLRELRGESRTAREKSL
jgi:hypothetical protein